MKKPKKTSFSSFTPKTALQKLKIDELSKWQPSAAAVPPSAFFQERRKRLEEYFDLLNSEKARELLIDAVCEEVLSRHTHLKMWKAAPLEGEDTAGVVDYLLAPKKRYLENPLLCVVEAKKDDFIQGEAQCLVEMQACYWNNAQSDHTAEIFGIVTNGEMWKFYRLDSEKVYEALPYTIGDLPRLLGVLDWVFEQCETVAQFH